MTSEELVQELLADAPGAPIMTVREAVRWAMRELCDQGNAWVVDDEPVVVAADTPYAELEAPQGGEPVRVLEILLAGRRLTPGADYRQTSPSRIELNRAVGASALYGRLAVRPSSGSSLPDELLTLHAETLKHGARSRLLMMPQSWRDPDLSLFHRQRWVAGINDAKRLAAYGHQAGGARVKLRRFI